MHHVRIPHAFAFAVVTATMTACEGAPSASADAVEPPPQCNDRECFEDPSEPNPIPFIENHTGADIELVLHRPSALAIDRRIVEGTVHVPIPDSVFGPSQRVSLPNNEAAPLEGNIQIIRFGDDVPPAGGIGGIVRLGDSEPVLVVGRGKVFVRLDGNGKPFLEPEDPKTTSIVPTHQPLAECAAGSLVPPFDDAPSFFSGDFFAASVARGPDGCRTFSIDSDDIHAPAEVRACIPDAAYPFADGESLRVHGEKIANVQRSSSEIVFTDDHGHTLGLHRIGFIKRTEPWIEGLEVALDDDPSCGSVDATCGDLEVPARITARTADGTIHHASFGEPIAGGPGETFFVLQATSHPVFRLTCGDETHAGNAGTTNAPNMPASSTIRMHARAWIAKVTK